MNNPPAYPQTRTLPDGSHEECEGLSIRDYFAAKAMQMYILENFKNKRQREILDGSDKDGCYWSDEDIAWFSYVMAEAMMEARENNE